MDRTHKFSLVGVVISVAFTAYYLAFGITTGSWWLLTLGSYYLILTLIRLAVLRSKRGERFISSFTGWMLMLLSVPLGGTVILSAVRDRGQRLHMIVMIAMAAYAFTRISFAIVNLIKSHKSKSKATIPVRCISFSDALASLFALQRSMLVSFEGMSEAEIVIMNVSLGSAVCVIVFLLGLYLVRRTKITED